MDQAGVVEQVGPVSPTSSVAPSADAYTLIGQRQARGKLVIEIN